MSRGMRDAVAGGRSAPAAAPSSSSLLLLQRRVRALAAGGAALGEGADEGLDLFSTSRRSVSIAGGGESDRQNVPPNLGRISVGSAKLMSGMDDLLSAADMGKHDYDWLLTPPGSPLSFMDTKESQPSSAAPTPKSNPSARSVSTGRVSRFSVPQTEKNHSTRSARSSSVTRSSISTTHSSSHISSSSNRTAVLNMSTTSVTSLRPSTPSNCPTTVSSTRQSAPTSSRPSRSSTPAKIRSTPGSASHNSRPSTPTSRSQNSTTLSLNSSSTVSRSSSRPSTPTRRAPVQTSAPVAMHAPTVGRTTTINSRTSGPPSRSSSPGPRGRAPSQPLGLPDFPLDAPPNLRMKVPERPASAGRARPGLPLTVRANLNSEAVPTVNPSGRRSSSPVVTRVRLPDNSPKLRLQSNGHEASSPEMKKPIQQENVVRKPLKTTTTMESTGFGRTISKPSLDMALRHMDIHQGRGGIRGASLYPQSIRSTVSKVKPARMSNPIRPVSSTWTDTEDSSCDGRMSCSGAASENGDTNVKSPVRTIFVPRASEPDVFESSRYDSMLLKEDSRNLNWLHSIEDKSDQSPVFDHGFEPLSEPFVLL